MDLSKEQLGKQLGGQLRTARGGQLSLALDANDLRLRPATSTDWPKIVDVCRSTQVFSDAELLAVGNDLADCVPSAGDHTVVAVGPMSSDQSREAVWGFVQYSPAPICHGTWYVYWIAVAKQVHGMGVGKQLLKQAEADVAAAGGRIVIIETSSRQPYAATRAFYLGLGYQLVAQVPDYYGDGDDKCIFWRRLGDL